jgi:hypothetical protein
MTATRAIIDLRKLLAERFPQRAGPATSLVKTGIAALDEASGGGLRQSAITEVITPQRSAGSACLIHTLLTSAWREQYFIALIDGRDSFDTCALDNACLRHLLWVRCTTAVEVIKAADMLLRDGNFRLVIVDLVLNAPEELRTIPPTSWYRLQRLAENVPTACLVLSRRSMVSSAQLKLVLENSWTLKDLDEENAPARLRFRMQRVHLRPEAGDQRREIRN